MRMRTALNNAADFVEMMRRKAPETLDLFTAETEAEFENAFDALLERAVIHLEANSRNFENLSEEGLSAVLAAGLTMPGLTVTQETHANGHVDLTIEADHCFPARRKLGEAKIYNGPKYHFDGLNQLLGRYTKGREGRGLLIVYFRQKGIVGLVHRIREAMDRERPSGQTCATRDHALRWSFISSHTHSSGECLEVGHIGCNLFLNE